MAHYRLDGNGEDASGNGNHGVLTAVGATEDRHGVAGGACAFNGSISVITVPHSATVDVHGNQSLTVAAWIKPAAPRNEETLVAKWGPGFREDDQYMLYLTGSGYQTWMVSDGRHEEQVVAAAPVRAGIWHHVCGVFDHGAQQMRIYLDGKLVGQKAVAVSIQSVKEPLRLGKYGGTDAFVGVMDDVRIYDRALSAQEIQDLIGAAKLTGSDWLSGFGAFEVTLTGVQGSKYRIEASIDLVRWTEVSTVVVENGPVSLMVPVGDRRNGHVFYRAVEVP